MFVKNWQQVTKSLAVWLPVLVTTLLAIVQNLSDAQLIPDGWLPIVVGISGAIGWVIKQPSIRKE